MSSFARLIGALAALTLAAATTAGALPGSAAAAGAPTDGSGWGPDGLVASDSEISVRWDNVGNPASDVVYRDGRQEIPHTAGKTYDDVDPAVVATYQDYFSASNGFGGLSVSVSQTDSLLNQTVTVVAEGAKGGAPYVGGQSVAYLQVFQCWGGLGADGAPDLTATQPDPATCQVGAVGADASGNGTPSTGRFLGNDPLAVGGDWSQYYGSQATTAPFTAIDGTVVGGGFGLTNEFFDHSTTNEFSDVILDRDGAAYRQFEIQTTSEASGLGCGRRADVPSTAMCWLVVVPRIANVMGSSGPISPTLWAQRLQVRLGFRDIQLGCPGGQARSLVGGSELLAPAMASWTPGLCGARKIALGYTQLGDEVAREQFVAGANDAVLTSEPVESTGGVAQIPAALTAAVVAYNLTYQPACTITDQSTEQTAQSCGYGSLEEMRTDNERANSPVRDLRLDARLLAKLLTQSYQASLIPIIGGTQPAWIQRNRPEFLAKDPEFKRLNPDLAHENVGLGVARLLDHVLVEGLRSDAATRVWQWILGDPEASAFLSGCPDPDGMVVNPFYSTRTFVGCEGEQATLAAEADADRAETTKASGYVDLALTYPPDGSPYPLPTWQDSQPTGKAVYSLADHLPRVDSMPIAARDVAIGYVPRNGIWCSTDDDPSCLPAPGKWKDPKGRGLGSAVGAMAIVDAGTAARFQVPTARLCDSNGQHCVGADTASLAQAASEFVPTATAGVVGPGPADYAGGAYPLTLPVYAAVSTELPLADRDAYASAFEYVVTAGQVPGFGLGDLPPGYTPLTPDLVNVAKAQIAVLRGPAIPVSTTTAKPKPKPTKHSASPSTSAPVVAPVVAPAAPTAPAAAPAAPETEAAPQLVTVAAGTESWPSRTMPLLVLAAALTGAAGPLLRLRGRVRLRR